MKTVYHLATTILVILLWSCNKNEQPESGDLVVEGQLVSIDINIDHNELTRTGLGQSQEQAVKNVFVMVFDKTGTKVSQSYFDSNISTNLANVSTVSGTDMSVYVVANLSEQNTGVTPIDHYFRTTFTVSRLNQMLIKDLASDLNLNRSLVMYGSVTGLTISPSTVKHVTVPLNYAVAKVTLYVVKALTNAADSYNLTNWTVTNYPQKSYLFSRPTDAVDPSVSADFANSATSLSWVDTTLVINGTNTPAQYAFLYMYENRRGTNSNTTELQKAGNAPHRSTAIVLQGYYKSNANNKVTGINTTIYLGNNNINDYNVNRGKEYSYIATIKGINDITVDSRVTANTYGYQVNLYNPTLDCHPDWRPLQINSWPGKSEITIYNSDGVTPCTWLHLSTINLHQSVSNARVTYNPLTDMVNTLTLTFPDNSPAAITSQMVYLYADENLTTSSRSAIVSINSIEGLTNSQIITIPVTQKGYQTMGNVGFRSYSTTGAVNTNDDYILVVENIEETSLNLTPGAVAGSEALTNMQWGYNLTVSEPTANAVSDYYYRNGYPGTLWLVYGNTTGAAGSVLKPPFGRLSAANASTASVTITEDAMHPIFNTYPARYCFEKNRDLDGDGHITSLNSNNINEINWYLPSAEELYSTYVGQYALTTALTGANYHVSSEVYGSNNSTNSMSYGTGIGGPLGKSSAVSVRCVRRIYQTQPQATKNSPYNESSSRIVNNSGYNASALRSPSVACPVPIHSYNGTVNLKISPRFQVAKTDCLLNGSSGAATMTWAQANGWTTASDNSNNTGVIASPATGCQAYSETGAPAGTWRLPTQREMYTIFFLRKELLAGQDGYVAMAAPNYWAATTLGGTLGWYGVRGNSTLAFGGKTSNIAVRCIRDL